MAKSKASKKFFDKMGLEYNENISIGKAFKTVFKSVREYKKYALWTPVFMMIEAIMECCLPWAMTNLLDSIKQIEVNGKSISIIIPWVIAMIAMAMVSLASAIAGGVFASKASNGFATNLRSDIYKKIQSFSFGNIDKFSASSLITRMTYDTQSAQRSFQMCIRIVIRAPLMIIFSAVMAFVTGGKIAWIFLALLPLVVAILLLIMFLAMPIFTRVFTRYDKLNDTVKENISGIRTVKAYVREDFEKEKFNNASNALVKDFIKAEKIAAWEWPSMNAVVHSANVLICGIVSYKMFYGAETIWNPETEQFIINWTSYSPSQMSALMTYGVQILVGLFMVAQIFIELLISVEGMHRIAEVLLEEPMIKNPENPVMEVPDGSVDFNNVSFKYYANAEKNTLENINIHIKSGEFVGIIGSTGSGKTSIVNLISRLYDVNSGEVKVGGINVKDYDMDVLRNKVSVVLQKNLLFSGTVADNLRWGDKFASDEELRRATDIAQATEFVDKFKEGYDHHIEQGGTNVSGGQKQRLCIARAILKKPNILILDDSTSAVDTNTDRLIRKGLRDEIPNTTKIVIAQRISSIEDADQIIVLDNGTINQIGTHEELLKTNKIYQEVYYTQNQKGEE